MTVTLQTPVEALRLTVVDVETTGLYPAAGDRVCEVALLQVHNEREVARFSSLVHPQRSMSAAATAVNGITDAMLAGAPPFATVLPVLCRLLHGAVLVAHNAAFDVSFLCHEFRLAGQSFPEVWVVDTLTLARTHYCFPSNSLEAIAKTLGIVQPVRHRALADVLTTWQVLCHFLADMRRRGPVTLAHLLPVSTQPGTVVPATVPPGRQEALAAGKLVRLRYQAGKAPATERVVRPLEVYDVRGYRYLRAFCHLRQDERNFRLDRIVALQLLSDA